MSENVHPVSRKIAMAAKVISRTETARSVSNRYNLSKRSVFRYMNQLQNALAMKEDRGRPRIFDHVSMKVLHDFFDSEDPPLWEDVKKVLLEQQQKSWCRLHHTSLESISPTNGPKKMSKRSIRRYLKVFNYVRE